MPEIVIVDMAEYGLAEGGDVADLIEEMRLEGKDNEAVQAALSAIIEKHGKPFAAPLTLPYNGQPAPLPADFETARLDDGGKRPVFANFKWTKSKEKDPETGAEVVVRQIAAVPCHEIREQISRATNGWPCRVHAPGARQPLLFVDIEQPGRCEGRVRWFEAPEKFSALLHEWGEVRFRDKRDARDVKFTGEANVFHAFGGAEGVAEFRAVEMRPHEPPIPGHYYAYRPPSSYRPTGERLAGLLKFFTNAKTPASHAILAAAIVTPGWGGSAKHGVFYGKRPMLIFDAVDVGSGKSTLAEKIGQLWGGIISVQLSQRSQDELLSRLLSPAALTKRVALIDNVKGQALDSAQIEGLITAEEISGKRMYTGEATRPNTLTWLVTINNARLSRDVAMRSFFVQLARPEYNADWDKRISEYMVRYREEIVADAIALLRSPAPKKAAAPGDRWDFWVDEVLARVVASPVVRAVVGEVEVGAILEENNLLRAACDIAAEQASDFWHGLLERVARNYYDVAPAEYGLPERYRISKPPAEIFIPSGEMLKHWEDIFNRKVNSGWLKSTLVAHVESGRILGLEYKRRETGRGWILAGDVVEEFLRGLEGSTPAAGNVTPINS